MGDGGAEIFDVVQPDGGRDRARLGGADPELEPERARSCRDRVARDVRARLRAAEDVHEIDRLLDLGQRLHARNAEHLVAVPRRHGNHAVAVARRYLITPWLGREGRGEAPTSAVAPRRISTGLRIGCRLPRR
jgi:hypothetical protein